MKISWQENDGSFWIDLEAETLAEAAMVTRFGIGATKEILWVGSSAGKSGEFHASIGIKRDRGSDGSIPKSRGRK